ncbi:MAG: M23 family metallopeptidase [Candidatus Omnitrophica bacterium]|nr:M23 family metallopeptidase [Candidatus Omnitrophota bacterium]
MPTRLAVIAVPLLALLPMAAASTPLWERWQWACREPTFAWPVGGPARYTLRHDVYGAGTFGSHRSGGRSHNGIDLAAPVGTPVGAARSGIVRYGQKRNGMGKYLEVVHPDGCVTLYGHLSRLLVRDGQFVARGQPIGLVGKTGNARPRAIHPHLHFEIRLRGVPVDPLGGYLDGTGGPPQ